MIHRTLAILAASLVLSSTGFAKPQPRQHPAHAQKGQKDADAKQKTKSNGGVISINFPNSGSGTTGWIKVIHNQSGHDSKWQYRRKSTATWLPPSEQEVNTLTPLLTATDYEVKILPKVTTDTFTTSPLLIRVYPHKVSEITISYP